MNIKPTIGLVYTAEVHDRFGNLLDREEGTRNIVPLEGLRHVLGVVFKGVTQVTTWFLAPFEGNYTPLTSDTGGSFPSAAVECTAYAESVRQTFTSGAVGAGSIDNSATRAQFTMNANKTVYGVSMCSAAAKGSTTQTLLSAVRFTSAKVLNSGDVLSVTAGLTLTST